MINIGTFQLTVSEIAKKNSLKKYEVDVLLYASENPSFTQYQVQKFVPACRPSVMSAMKRLTTGGWVRIVMERKPGVSRKYALSGKGRSLVTEFNIILGNL